MNNKIAIDLDDCQPSHEQLNFLKSSGYETILISDCECREFLTPQQKNDTIHERIYFTGGCQEIKRDILRHIKPFFLVDNKLSVLHSYPSAPARVWIDKRERQDGYMTNQDITVIKSFQDFLDYIK